MLSNSVIIKDSFACIVRIVLLMHMLQPFVRFDLLYAFQLKVSE